MATYQEQIERRRREREAKEKADAEQKLNADQIKNWRVVLSNMGVPFAMSIPDSMVQQFRDAMQSRINAELGSSPMNSERHKE